MLLKRFARNNDTRRTDGSAAVPRRRLSDNTGNMPSAPRTFDETLEPTASSRHQFRRNQTLTGSSSESVASAAEMSGTIQ